MEKTAATHLVSLPQKACALFEIVYGKQFLQGLKPNPLCFLCGPIKVVP